MNRLSLLLACALLMSGTVPGAGYLQAAPIVIDRILVVVNGQPITRSRMSLYQAYLEHFQGSGLGWPSREQNVQELSPEDLLRVLVIDELLFEAANRVESLRIRESDLEARIEAFTRSFSSFQAYQVFIRRHELQGETLREFFSRRLRVEAYIALKLGGARMSARELQEYYEAHRERFGEQSFEQVQDEVTRQLFAARSSERFEQWTGDLYTRANVIVPSRGVQR